MPYEHLVKLKQPSNRDARSITPTQIIFHSFAGGWNGSVGWIYSQSLESHTAVRNDGFRQQFMDYTKAADANRNANRRPDGTGAISCETESDIPALLPWTDDQIASMIEWAAELCIKFNIPTRVCRNPSDPGLGYHTLFGSPSEWTPVAKSCPGPARIKQFRDVLVPGIAKRVAQILAGKPETPDSDSEKDWFDMATKEELEAVVRAVVQDENGKLWNGIVGRIDKEIRPSLANLWSGVNTRLDQIRAHFGLGDPK